MNCNSLSFMIFSSILMFDSCLSLKDESKIKKVSENLEYLYKSLINIQQDDYHKVHSVNKRNAPEFMNVLIEVKNQLNDKLLNSQRRIKKFQIQRRSDDTNQQSVSYSEPKLNSIKSVESIQQNSMIPVYRGTDSGYPSLTYYNERQPSTVFYRNPKSFRRQSEEKNPNNTSDNYEEDVPNIENGGKAKNNLKSNIDSDNYENPKNFPKLIKEYTHTIKHDGRGFHTSYFIPNIDKTIEEHKKEFKSKPINYWKSGTDKKIVKTPIKPDTFASNPDSYASKPRNAVKPIRQVVKTVPVVKPVQYSPVVQMNGYNANTYPVTSQPMIGAPVYRHPSPADYQNLFFGYTTPHFQMSVPSVPTVSHQLKQQKIQKKGQQKPDEQFKRQPVLNIQQSTEKPDTILPVHWTRVVAEINDQKNKVTGDWRTKPIEVYPRPIHPTTIDNNRYFSVGSIDMI